MTDAELASLARNVSAAADCSPLEALAGLVVLSEGSPFGRN